MDNFLRNFFRLTRPLSNVKNIALIVLAFYLSKASFNAVEFIGAFLSASFICSAFYVFNALSDLDLDRNNGNKKHYSEATSALGVKNSYFIFLVLLIAGLVVGLFINVYFCLFLLALAGVNYLYSSKRFRFKERFILDIIFGGSLTFLLRFLAFWYVFSYSFPPLFVLLILIFGKSAGYLLYKELDYEHLLANRVRNSVTVLSKRSKIIVSVVLWALALACLVFLCINHSNINILGSLPLTFLLLVPISVPPILVIYFSICGGIRMPVKTLRVWNIIYWVIAALTILAFL